MGRVDCIRAASPEALAWAKAMCQGDPQGQASHATADGSPKRVQFTIYSVTETWHFSYAILVQRKAAHGKLGRDKAEHWRFCSFLSLSASVIMIYLVYLVTLTSHVLRL